MSLSAGIIRPSVMPSTSTKTSSTPAQSCASSARAALPYSRRRAPRTPGCSAAATRSASRELGRCARPGGCCERAGSALKAKACPACSFRDGGVLGPVSRLRADALVVSGMPDAQGVPYILICAPPLPPLERWGIGPRTSTGTELFEGSSKYAERGLWGSKCGLSQIQVASNLPAVAGPGAPIKVRNTCPTMSTRRPVSSSVCSALDRL